MKTIHGVDLTYVDAFRKERKRHGSAEPAGAKTVHGDVVLLRQLVNFALKRKMIQVDPFAGLELEKPKPTPQPCWTREEVEQILVAAREPQQSQLTLLAETGTRVGELQWPMLEVLPRHVEAGAPGWTYDSPPSTKSPTANLPNVESHSA